MYFCKNRKKVIILLCVAFILTACSNNLNDFKNEVENFTTHYEKYEGSDDALTEDINLKVAAGDLMKMSQYYEETKSRDDFNKILSNNISKEMFDTIYKYNEENTEYTIQPAIIEYFQNVVE